MPIYEYICQKCGKNQEILLKTLDENPHCQECQSDDLKRKLSLFSSRVGSSAPSCGAGGCCASSHSCPAQGECLGHS